MSERSGSERAGSWQRQLIGRRALLRGAAVGGAGLASAALIGCGGGAKTVADAPASAPAADGSPAAEQPQVSEAFVLIQTRDAVSLEPLDAQVYTVPERIGLVYPRLVYATLGSKDPTDVTTRSSRGRPRTAASR